MFLTENHFFLPKKDIANTAVSYTEPTPTSSILPTPIIEICDESYLAPIDKPVTYLAKTPMKSIKYSLKRLASLDNKLIYMVNDDPSQLVKNECKNSFLTGIAPIQALSYLDLQSNTQVTPSTSNKFSLFSSLVDFHTIPNTAYVNSSWNSTLKIPTGIKLFGLEFIDLDIKHLPVNTKSMNDMLEIEVSMDAKNPQLFTKYFSDDSDMKIDQPIITYKMKKNIGLTNLILNFDPKKSAQIEIKLISD